MAFEISRQALDDIHAALVHSAGSPYGQSVALDAAAFGHLSGLIAALRRAETVFVDGSSNPSNRSRPAPAVIEDDRLSAQSIRSLLSLDEMAGMDALEKICAAARHWARCAP